MPHLFGFYALKLITNLTRGKKSRFGKNLKIISALAFFVLPEELQFHCHMVPARNAAVNAMVYKGNTYGQNETESPGSTREGAWTGPYEGELTISVL